MNLHFRPGTTLTRLLGHRATLATWDTLVLDRWLWLCDRLPRTNETSFLLDVGCGTGAFTIGAALRGYEATGLTFDENDCGLATRRARLCSADNANFRILDVRHLGEESDDLGDRFDVVISFENIEHILDDRKLMIDMGRCLRPGGRLLLTTPNIDYRPISASDAGSFRPIETGGHVRKGYDRTDLERLCGEAGLVPIDFSWCSGYLSQRITRLFRALCRIHPVLGWVAILPLRPLPPLFDRLATRVLRWPYYSICVEAVKPPSDCSSGAWATEPGRWASAAR